MALHDEQVSESILELEFEVFILRETLSHILQYVDLLSGGLDENRLKRQAYKYLKEKYPDEDLTQGDWIN